MIIVDGQLYNDKSEVPDLGSLVCHTVTDGNNRHYKGLEKDRDKLPTYDDLGADSDCLMNDTRNVYSYNPSDKKWYRL